MIFDKFRPEEQPARVSYTWPVFLFFAPLYMSSCFSHAQEKEPAAEKFEKKHSIGIVIGHELAFSGRDANGNNKTLHLPYWGIDYNFQFAPKFAIGLHTDIVIETFEVEKDLAGGEETVERTRPVAPAVMGLYKPTSHWTIGLGMGAEFEKAENYVLNRLAIEYGSEFGRGWEVAGSLQYDFRWDAYDTFTIGLGVSREIGRKKRKSE